MKNQDFNSKSSDSSLSELLCKSKTTDLEKVDTNYLVEIINNLQILAFYKKFNEIDKTFKNLDLSQLSIVVMVTLLRTCFPFKELLEEWKKLLDSAITETSKRGKNSSKIFVGLI